MHWLFHNPIAQAAPTLTQKIQSPPSQTRSCLVRSASHYALNFNEFLQVYVTKIEGFKNEAGFMDKAGVSSDAFNLLHSVFNMSTH